MKRSFSFLYNGEKIQVAAERRGDTLTIEKDGRVYTLTLLPEHNGSTAVAAPGSPGPTDVPPGHAPAQAASAALSRVSQVSHSNQTPEALAAPEFPEASSAGGGEIPAPMTGVIKEVLVATGDRVEEGELLMIMEAMKMDIEVTSHFSGTVRKIHAQSNDSVKEGQPLVNIG
jgi:biotin carboxyl carrier protein